MEKVTVRVPATTANLGVGFDTLGCALRLYNTLSFTLSDKLSFSGCDAEYQTPDNLAYQGFAALYTHMGLPAPGVHIDIAADIPVCRGLGSSAAMIAAGALAANRLGHFDLDTATLLSIVTPIEGHPDNLAPALFGGLTASMVDNGLPITVNFPLHPDWEFLALVPDFDLPTPLARSVLPNQIPRADAVYNVSHGAMVLKALELGDEKLLRNAMQDRIHQGYRKSLIQDYDKIEALVRTTGAAFCLSGAGPTLLCITRQPGLQEKLAKKIDSITEANWQMLPLHIDFTGAKILKVES